MNLVERLKTADVPDRSLDWEIHLRNGLYGVGAYGDHPHYTESLDAAISLIPEGYVWDVNHWGMVQLYWREDLPGAARAFLVSDRERRPAIAVCIAAMRAHSAALEQEATK
jgi:hypothetical protein